MHQLAPDLDLNATAHATSNLLFHLNTSPASREAASKAYEFALNHIGQDDDSREIWSDYIQFVKAGEVRHHLATFNMLLIPVADNYNMGRTTKDGRSMQGLPSRRPNPSRKCQNALVRTRGFREQPEQDNSMLLSDLSIS